MKYADTWIWPDGEQHLLEWIANPKNRLTIHGRPAYQGKKQLACLDQCLPEKRRTMIDVGAHIGLWSFNFSRWFDRVEAFEPVEAHRECWVANMGATHALPGVPTLFEPFQGDKGQTVSYDNCTLYPFALGERPAMVGIHTASTSSGDSWVKGKGSVEMRTLDSFGFMEVDFIKIDCEGYEEFVLRGAADTIKRWKPVICVEQKREMATERFGLKKLGAVKLLEGWGYKIALELSGDFIMKATK
jgi:FkbM family methyltransferase